VEGSITGHQQQLDTAQQQEATTDEGRTTSGATALAKLQMKLHADCLLYSKSTSVAKAKSKNKVNSQAKTTTTV